MENLRGTVFNIQRYSTEDGPGIRTTVFLKGCPLRCLWCSNPESQSPVPQLGHRASVCIRCGSCISVCPQNALGFGTDSNIEIDRSKCISCGTCVGACQAGSMKLYGKSMTVEEVYLEVSRDVSYYIKSGGGITVSGGEAMMQADFVGALLKRCHSGGIQTALDTCGYFSSGELSKVAGHVDLALFDIKHMDPGEHIRCTGVSNDLILKNARLMSQNHIPILIRIPLIPGFNDSEENLKKTALFIRGLDSVQGVTLLPYHNLGENKYKMLGMRYSLPELKKASELQIEQCKVVLEAFGLNCNIQ